MEEWKQLVYPGIPQDKNRFLISSMGRLMNKNTGTIYRPELLRTGYLSVRVGLSRCERIHIILHKAVAYTFIKNTKSLSIVNHKDGNKQNNEVSNLEWCTARDNVIHAYSNQLIEKSNISGENNSQSKLTEDEVSSIRKEYKRGSRQCGERALSRKYNVSHSTIHSIIKHKSWSHVGCCV